MNVWTEDDYVARLNPETSKAWCRRVANFAGRVAKGPYQGQTQDRSDSAVIVAHGRKLDPVTLIKSPNHSYVPSRHPSSGVAYVFAKD